MFPSRTGSQELILSLTPQQRGGSGWGSLAWHYRGQRPIQRGHDKCLAHRHPNHAVHHHHGLPGTKARTCQVAFRERAWLFRAFCQRVVPLPGDSLQPGWRERQGTGPCPSRGGMGVGKHSWPEACVWVFWSYLLLLLGFFACLFVIFFPCSMKMFIVQHCIICVFCAWVLS